MDTYDSEVIRPEAVKKRKPEPLKFPSVPQGSPSISPDESVEELSNLSVPDNIIPQVEESTKKDIEGPESVILEPYPEDLISFTPPDQFPVPKEIQPFKQTSDLEKIELQTPERILPHTVRHTATEAITESLENIATPFSPEGITPAFATKKEGETLNVISTDPGSVLPLATAMTVAVEEPVPSKKVEESERDQSTQLILHTVDSIVPYGEVQEFEREKEEKEEKEESLLHLHRVQEITPLSLEEPSVVHPGEVSSIKLEEPELILPKSVSSESTEPMPPGKDNITPYTIPTIQTVSEPQTVRSKVARVKPEQEINVREPDTATPYKSTDIVPVGTVTTEETGPTEPLGSETSLHTFTLQDIHPSHASVTEHPKITLEEQLHPLPVDLISPVSSRRGSVSSEDYVTASEGESSTSVFGTPPSTPPKEKWKEYSALPHIGFVTGGGPAGAGPAVRHQRSARHPSWLELSR